MPSFLALSDIGANDDRQSRIDDGTVATHQAPAARSCSGWLAAGGTERAHDRSPALHARRLLQADSDREFVPSGALSHTDALSRQARRVGRRTSSTHRDQHLHEQRPTCRLPSPGLGLIFDHTLEREGGTLFKGVKRALRTDVMFRKINSEPMADERVSAFEMEGGADGGALGGGGGERTRGPAGPAGPAGPELRRAGASSPR